MQEPLHFGHDAPRPVRRLAGREGRKPAQGQATVFEERLAQVPAAALGDEEHPPRSGAKERQQSRADDGKRVDSRHLAPAKRVEPRIDPLGTDDGGEQDPVVAPSLRHPPLPPRRDVGRAGKQPGAPGREDRPPGGAVHVRGGLALEVLLDEVGEEVDRGRGGAFEMFPEPGASRFVRGEVRDRADVPARAPEQAGASRPDHQHPARRASRGKCRRPSHRSAPSRTPPPTAAAPPARGWPRGPRAPAPAPRRPSRRARRSS